MPRQPNNHGDLGEAQTVVSDGHATTMMATPSHPGVVAVGGDLEGAVTSDRYAVEGLLGRGGMGEVYACRDLHVGRAVARKVLNRELSAHPESKQRFLREARLQGQLEHPAVVPVYDLGVAPDGDVYFSMKRVSGVTLAEILDGTAETDEHYTTHKLLAAFLQICRCVDYAHTRGVVHRDLKPDNIMLGRFGEVYVLDWGIAKLDADPVSTTDDDGSSVPVSAGDLSHTPTRAGQILGTPGYMSPEQVASAAQADGRSDVYALGAILFEVLAGEQLHQGNTVDDLLESTLQGADARISQRALEVEVAPELEAICMRATATDPESRYPGARAIHDEIERYLEGDRNLEMRRAAASDHAARAAAAADQVFASDDPEGAKRSRALGEVGRALALDPTSPAARQTLARLLTEPPHQPPPGALADIDATRAREERAAARLSAWAFAVVSVFASLPAIEVSLISQLPILLPFWAATAACFYLGYGERRLRYLPHLVVALVCTAVAAASGFMGPLVVTPALALAIAIVALNLGRGTHYRAGVVVATALTILVPALLEMTDVVTSSYRNVDGTIVITPRLFRVPDRPYPLAVLFACVVTTVVPALFVWRLARANHALRAQLHVLKWQLAKLVPSNDGADPP